MESDVKKFLCFLLLLLMYWNGKSEVKSSLDVAKNLSGV